MDTRMEMHELVAFNAAVSQGLDRRVDRINQASKDLKKFTGRHSGIDGKAAQAISAYISDVHLGGIMTMINEIIERFNQLNTMYIGHYPHVDEGSNDFFLLSQDYEEINSNAKRMRTKFSDDEEKLIAITNEVDDIVSSFSTNDAMTEFDKIEENFADINKNIHRQSRDWSSYESQCARRYAELDAAINVVKRLIDQYSHKSVADLGRYQEGLFAKDLSKKDMRIFDKLSRNIHHDKTLTKTAQKNLKALQRKYEQIEIERNKRDGWNSLIVESLFAVAGVTIGVCTGSLAVPLLLMGSSIFPVLELYENFNKAQTGKSEGDNLGKAFLTDGLALDKNTADSVYNLVDFGSEIVGSEGAFEALKDGGYVVSKGLKAKPLFSSLKNLGAKVVSVKNVKNAVRNVTDIKYVRATSKNLFKEAKAAISKDFIDIGNSTKIGEENNILREEILPHFNEYMKTSDIVKGVLKIYGTEAIVQAEKSVVKEYLLSPIVEATTDKIAGEDDRSFGHKFVNKIIDDAFGKLYKSIQKVVHNATDDNFKDRSKLNSVLLKNIQRIEVSDKSLQSQLNNMGGIVSDIWKMYK